MKFFFKVKLFLLECWRWGETKWDETRWNNFKAKQDPTRLKWPFSFSSFLLSRFIDVCVPQNKSENFPLFNFCLLFYFFLFSFKIVQVLSCSDDWWMENLKWIRKVNFPKERFLSAWRVMKTDRSLVFQPNVILEKTWTYLQETKKHILNWN